MKYFILIGSALVFSYVCMGSPQGFPVHTNTVVGNTSTQVVATNKDRGYILVQNNGAVACQLKFGGAITADNDGVVIDGGENYEAINSYIKSPIYMKCTANASVAVVESNY